MLDGFRSVVRGYSDSFGDQVVVDEILQVKADVVVWLQPLSLLFVR